MSSRTGACALVSLAAGALWLLPGGLPGGEHAADREASAMAKPTGAADVRCDRVLRPHRGMSINRAVHARRRAGVICLRGGTYRTGTVWLRRHGQTITSYPGEQAVWRGRIVVRGRNITLSHLTLDGSAGRGGGSLPSPTIHGAGFTLRDSDVTNRTGICVHPAPYGGLRPRSFTIERNRIHRCGRLPPTNHDHGVYVAAGTGVVRWNAIFDNADRGVQLYPRARRVQVVENTIDGNGQGVLLGNSSSGNAVSRNLITNSNQRWNVEEYNLRGGGNEVASNCVRANRRGYYSRRGGIALDIEEVLKLRDNSVAKVTYMDRAGKDFRPRSLPAKCEGMGAPADVAAP